MKTLSSAKEISLRNKDLDVGSKLIVIPGIKNINVYRTLGTTCITGIGRAYTCE